MIASRAKGGSCPKSIPGPSQRLLLTVFIKCLENLRVCSSRRGGRRLKENITPRRQRKAEGNAWVSRVAIG